MATGLCTADKEEDRPSKVLLSPRNQAKSAALATKFPALVEVAASNQAVVDGSDIVLLGVLPTVSLLKMDVPSSPSAICHRWRILSSDPTEFTHLYISFSTAKLKEYNMHTVPFFLSTNYNNQLLGATYTFHAHFHRLLKGFCRSLLSDRSKWLFQWLPW